MTALLSALQAGMIIAAILGTVFALFSIPLVLGWARLFKFAVFCFIAYLVGTYF